MENNINENNINLGHDENQITNTSVNNVVSSKNDVDNADVSKQKAGESFENSKPETDYERLSKLYNLKQEKPRKNAKVITVLSIITTIVVAGVGAFFAVMFLLKVLGMDSEAFFGQGKNVITFGIAGLTGFLFYLSSFVLIILIVGVSSWIMSLFIKLCKNLKQTKYQPYYVVAYNGTLIYTIVVISIILVLLGVAFGITVRNSQKFTLVLGLLVALITIIFAVWVDLFVELCIAKHKHTKLSDKQLKLDIKKEALQRYKFYLFKGGRDIKRAKTRRRWF